MAVTLEEYEYKAHSNFRLSVRSLSVRRVLCWDIWELVSVALHNTNMYKYEPSCTCVQSCTYSTFHSVIHLIFGSSVHHVHVGTLSPTYCWMLLLKTALQGTWLFAVGLSLKVTWKAHIHPEIPLNNTGDIWRESINNTWYPQKRLISKIMCLYLSRPSYSLWYASNYNLISI